MPKPRLDWHWLLSFGLWRNLADRQAAHAVRGRIDWKYALGLELTDPGFHHIALSEFHTRLITGNAELLLLDTLLNRFKELDLIKTRGRQRTDSTHAPPVTKIVCFKVCCFSGIMIRELERKVLRLRMIMQQQFKKSPHSPAVRQLYLCGKAWAGRHLTMVSQWRL
jgi:hypothetical protein